MEQEITTVETTTTNNSRKARGFYDHFSDEAKALYDSIIENKEYIEKIRKITKVRLAYLHDYLERKISEMKKENLTEFNDKQLFDIIKSVKVKSAIIQRKIKVAKYKYATTQLTKTEKNAARVELDNIFKSVAR